MTINEREIVLDALMEILEKGQYSHLVMKGVLEKYSFLTKQERSFIKRVCEGTIEQKIRLDYVINSFSKTSTKKMKPLIRTLLRMGTYQLLFMDSIPDSAVCNESVKLAAKRGFSPLKGFVNGVLRNIARNKDSIVYPDKEKDEVLYLSVNYSMPEWIVRMWEEQLGKEQTEKVLENLLLKRPLTIRVDEALTESEKEAFLKKLEQQEIVVGETILPYAYTLENIDSLEKVPGYEEGYFAVQDIASMMVVEMAGIREGDYVIDVCGAPGGKAMHAASRLKGTGHVLVRDLTEEKVSLIEENIARCGLNNITARIWDATVLDETLQEKADLVIADLPCSGLGVIGRKSDIKYRITEQDIVQIADLQRSILSIVSSYVKPGGTLMFSTCTISRKENEENREWFLSGYPFEMAEERLLLPGDCNSDGFYMVKLKRKEN